MTTLYKFKAYFTNAGVGTVQDPAPTCTVINMADDTKLADAQATTASTNMPGLYSYTYSGADGLDCVALFATTDTGCDVKQLASYVSEKITTNLNADVAGVEAKIDAIKEKTDNLPTDPADDSDIDAQLAAIKAETAAILVDTGTTLDGNITAILADTNEIQAELADGGRTDLLIDSIVGATTATGVLLKDTAIEAIFNDIVVTGTYTFAELMKIMASALAGELSGGGTTTLTFKSVDGASDVIEAIVDANGNRTSVTLTV